ncbi:40S ribosomal protein [Balamuthia mandrillaris]
MGISRDSKHKRRATGGKRKIHRKKRKFELGRPPAMTKLVPGEKRIRLVRCRGGNMKARALRLETGNFSWGSEVVTKKARLLAVVYNASNNELVRTNTLVKNAIIQIDATPFRQWFEQHYGVALGKKTKKEEAAKKEEGATSEKKSDHVQYKQHKRRQGHTLDPALEEQFTAGRLYACIASRPGQCGRCDGYILEGDELAFYLKKMQKKKGPTK